MKGADSTSTSARAPLESRNLAISGRPGKTYEKQMIVAMFINERFMGNKVLIVRGKPF